MRWSTVPAATRPVPVMMFLGGSVLLCALGARLIVPWTGRLLPGIVICPFRALTGLPCLTCGGTRALAALASGRFLEAVFLNPLVALTAAGVIAVAAGDGLRRVARWPAVRLEPGGREILILRGLTVAAVAGNWVYLLSRS